MNKEKQRIAFAKYREYTDIAWRVVCEGTGMDTWVLCSGIIGEGGCEIPDYGNNLRAMHEGEKILTNLTYEKVGMGDYVHNDVRNYPLFPLYLSNLGTVCGANHWSRGGENDIWLIVTATAEQRLEAILKTLNLWEQEA